MTGQRSILYPLRSFNKRILNRVTRRLAGVSRGPFAVVYHVGRRSGKAYETPVFAESVKDGFVLALTYGPDVDWYRNVIAAGQCRLRWHAKEYAIDKIEPVDRKIALQAFPQPQKLILGVVGIQHFIHMHIAQTTPNQESLNVLQATG